MIVHGRVSCPPRPERCAYRHATATGPHRGRGVRPWRRHVFVPARIPLEPASSTMKVAPRWRSSCYIVRRGGTRDAAVSSDFLDGAWCGLLNTARIGVPASPTRGKSSNRAQSKLRLLKNLLSLRKLVRIYAAGSLYTDIRRSRNFLEPVAFADRGFHSFRSTARNYFVIWSQCDVTIIKLRSTLLRAK